MAMLRVAFLASGTGSLLARVLATFAGDPRLRFVGLVADEKAHGSVERAAAAGLPVARVSRRAHPDLPEFNQRLYEALAPWEPDLIVSTFNHLVTAPVLERWPRHLVNVHYALLPAFAGLKPIPRALRFGVRLAGATVHLIDASFDEGPPILQAITPVGPGDTPAAVQDRLFHLAVPMLLQAIDWAADARLRFDVVDGRTRVRVEGARYDALPINPYPEKYAHLVPGADGAAPG
jgi:phosphoribosylglycinamide formyltransferase 1